MSITISAVGRAGRRGATRRVPNAETLLAAVDEWLPDATSDMLRDHTSGVRTADGAIEASFHPAARAARFAATDAGQLTVTATTDPVGPGYHTWIVRLLQRLGEDLNVAWAGPTPAGDAEESEVSEDPTGAFFSGLRADAERGHLSWLRSSLLGVRDARRAGQTRLHLGTPPGVRYTFDGAVATVLGPRDDAWVESALANPAIAADIWPWVADATDGRYHLNRALVLLWNEVRWRPPVGDRELAVLDEVIATLRRAYPLEPALPWPWPEWREAFVLRGQPDASTFQMLQRANVRAASLVAGSSAVSAPAPGAVAVDERPAAAEPASAETSSGAAIGYRRRPVTIIHEGWAVDLPGSFSEERTAEEWSGSDAGRSVALAATATAVGDAPMSPDAFLREFAAGLGSDAIEHDAGPVRGRARLASDSSTGVEVAAVEGYSAVRGSGAVIRIVIEDPNDWKWALDTWRGLRPA